MLNQNALLHSSSFKSSADYSVVQIKAGNIDNAVFQSFFLLVSIFENGVSIDGLIIIHLFNITVNGDIFSFGSMILKEIDVLVSTQTYTWTVAFSSSL